MPSVWLACPGCQATFESNAAGGQQVACARCGLVVIVPPSAESPASWYLARDNQRYGPYARDQLTKLAQAGNLQLADLVWREGMANWVEARSLVGLFPPGMVSPLLPQADGSGETTRWLTPQRSQVAAAFGAFVWLQLRRAFALHLRRVPVSPREQELLTAAGVEDEIGQRYFVWRRSLFLLVGVLTALSVLFQAISKLTQDYSILSGFGIFVEVGTMLAAFALPAGAFAALGTWRRLKLSRGFLLAGWLASFLAPILFALFPSQWFLRLDASVPSAVYQIQVWMIRILAGLAYYLTLMPAVLSLLPGVQRACLRLKGLFPESVLPGWILVLISPLYTLLLLASFILLIQIASDWLLLGGVLLWMSAPLVYFLFWRPFTSPLTSFQTGRIQWIQLGYLALVGLAAVLLLTFLLTFKIELRSKDEVLHLRAIGWDAQTSLARPWDIPKYLIGYAGLSFAVTALAFDYLLLMNLSAWSRTREFARSGAAEEYDRAMEAIEKVIA